MIYSPWIIRNVYASYPTDVTRHHELVRATQHYLFDLAIFRATRSLRVPA